MTAPDLSVYMVESMDDFVRMQEYAADYKGVPLVLDLETDSVSEKRALIFGIGLCWNDSEAFYIPVRSNTDKALLWSETDLQTITEWIYAEAARQKLVGHNVIYDVLVFENNTGMDLSKYIYSDSMLLKHAVDEERPFGLKEVAVKYLGEWADKAQQTMKDSIKANGGVCTKENMEMWKASKDILGEYCGWDCLLTRRLFDLFEPRIHAEGLTKLFYEEETMPLYRTVAIDMKRKGFRIDLPYFEKLKSDIAVEVDKLETEIYADISDLTTEYVAKVLDKGYGESRAGNFPKMLAASYGIELPVKDGKISMIKKLLSYYVEKKLWPDWFEGWLVRGEELHPEYKFQAQLRWHKEINPEDKSVFNLKSNDHLGWLFFERLGETPLGKTEGGKPQCDDTFLETMREKYAFVAKLGDLKKLQKLSSTYIDGLLDRQVDGIIYTSYLLFGTTSGRFSSASPNLQNLPRVKEDDADLSPLVLHYTNAIKKGFIAPDGYKLVNADYSALEPRIFAHTSGDEKLRDVFRKGEDLYSAIAINAFAIEGCSADPSAPNYLKKKYPELRQKAKAFALAVVYGGEAGRISKLLDIDYQSADQLIESYLDAYPELRKYMERCDYLATKQGIARSEFGRVRHLPQAKSIYAQYGNRLLMNGKWAKEQGLGDIRYELKSALNNSKNFPIQAMAAHVVNRSMIALAKSFKEHKIDGWMVAQTHDEVTCVVREDQTDLAAKLLKEAMENTTKISIPLVAEPVIGNNWAESK